jgi:periplasmic divalent cation tolerance protein
MNSDKTFLQIVTTVENLEVARHIALSVIERRLAACVQVDGPIASVYLWKGEVTESSEYRLTMKTSAARGEDLVRTLRELHPYELPEIIVGRLDASADYANWIEENTGLGSND